MASLKRRHNKWEAQVRIPRALAGHHDGRKHLYRTLGSRDRLAAKAEADAWEAMLRVEWAERQGHDSGNLAAIRAVYERIRQKAVSGTYKVHGGSGDDPALLGIEHELDRIAEQVGQDDLTPEQGARVAALQDATRDILKQPVEPRRELEPSFKELADQYLRLWKTDRSLKGSNTEQQKAATFGLFAGFFGGRPIREVRKRDASAFMDALRQLDPNWRRSPSARNMSWSELQRNYGSRDTGLADATMNRHAATLQSLWEWAAERELCEGRNPFAGFHKRLQSGRNVRGYVAWEPDELAALFAPPPKRQDLLEIMLVGMFTGMRLDEIASLRLGQLRTQDGVEFIQVDDAKTPAGVRQVPLHPSLAWLSRRKHGAASGRIWPKFNPEGPGKKPGADAGREFSRFKQARGFADRRKVFHSFRKNVTRIMERAGVPENEWAQVLGHEKGFTYGRYNPDGIAIERKAEIVSLIQYPGIDLPKPDR